MRTVQHSWSWLTACILSSFACGVWDPFFFVHVFVNCAAAAAASLLLPHRCCCRIAAAAAAAATALLLLLLAHCCVSGPVRPGRPGV
jgi:hypothetical protein